MQLFETAKAIRAAQRVAINRGEDVLPGLVSDSPEYLQWMEALADELTETIPSSVDKTGVAGKNATPGNFYGLRNVAGYVMTPMNVPMIDNAPLRSEMGLTGSFRTPRHEQIWASLWDLMFLTRVPTSFRIQRDSSTTFPFFETDLVFKKNLFAQCVSNLDKILSRVDRGELQELFSENGFVLAYYMGARLQPDSVRKEGDQYTTKERKVSTKEYTLSRGKRGSMVAADKSVIVNGSKVPGHFAMRKRSVYGMASCANYLMGAMFSELREHYLKKYAFTWKHTTVPAIQEKIRRYREFIGFDVKLYDQTVAAWQLKFFLDRFAEHMDERWVKLMTMAAHAPYYTPDPAVGGKDGFWVGHPLRPSNFCLNMGLPSGVAYNPDVGKYTMTATYLCLLDDHFGDVLEFGMDKVLQGEHPNYALLDMGDDAVILTNSLSFKEIVLDRLNAGEQLSSYFKLEKEEGISFLGNVFYKGWDGQITLAPNIVTFFLNWFAPEKGIRHRSRRLWPIGWMERKKYYSQAPFFKEAYEILCRTHRDRFGSEIDATVLQAPLPRDALAMSFFTDVDRIVLEDPTKLHYRFQPSDVSPEVLDAIVGTIPEAEVLEFTERIWRN